MKKLKSIIRLLNLYLKEQLWCASSTHNSEEEFVGIIHNKLKKNIKIF